VFFGPVDAGEALRKAQLITTAHGPPAKFFIIDSEPNAEGKTFRREIPEGKSTMGSQTDATTRVATDKGEKP